jgi:hypothetical protein
MPYSHDDRADEKEVTVGRFLQRSSNLEPKAYRAKYGGSLSTHCNRPSGYDRVGSVQHYSTEYGHLTISDDRSVSQGQRKTVTEWLFGDNSYATALVSAISDFTYSAVTRTASFVLNKATGGKLGRSTLWGYESHAPTVSAKCQQPLRTGWRYKLAPDGQVTVKGGERSARFTGV